MREPKLGVLDYMLRGFRLRGERDLVFVPLGINYDRVLEDRTLAAAERPRSGRDCDCLCRTLRFVRAQPLARAAQRMAPLRLRLRQLRHADLDARSAASTTSRSPARSARAAVAALGAELMQAVGRIVPVRAGAADRERVHGAPAARAVGARAQGGGRAPARAAARPRARTSTCRAAISTTR